MLRLVALIATCLALGCELERIELVGGLGSDSGQSDRGPADLGPIDSGDTGAFDSGTLEAGPMDGDSIDADPMDADPMDATSTCVCRLTRCTIDDDCRAIARSTCNVVEGACTGSLGTCSSSSDCMGGFWGCTVDETTLDPCP